MIAGPGPSVFGEAMNNPYELTNVQEAAAELGLDKLSINATHVYLKFKPADWQDVVDIADYEEQTDYEFDTEPIHLEVLYDGEDEYVDPNVADNTPSPEYGAVTYDDYQNNLPDVPYEVLDIMHIPTYESRLTYVAFVMSGNEQYYEATEGFCHPDCPAWPLCLDEPEYTCVPDLTILQHVAVATPAATTASTTGLSTVDMVDANNRPNMGEYLLDVKMGYDGELNMITDCTHIPPEPPCDEDCSLILAPIPHDPDDTGACMWRCICGNDGGGIPSGHILACNVCHTYDDGRKPGGRIRVEDSQLGREGVRRIRVKTTLKNWGFKWTSSSTNDEGCWKIDRKYRTSQLKVKIVFRDVVSDRMVIRAVRNNEWWNAILKPAEFTWKIRRNNREWNNLCLEITQDGSGTSIDEQTYSAAITNNGIHEYYENTGLPNPGKIRVLLQNHIETANAAPMIRRIALENPAVFFYPNLDIPDMWPSFLRSLEESPIVVPPILLTSLWTNAPDVILHFGDIEASDRKRRIVYHEMAHVSQYEILGASWWTENINYLLIVEEAGQQAS